MTTTTAKKTAKVANDKGEPKKAPKTIDPETGIDLSKVKIDIVDFYLDALGLSKTGPKGPIGTVGERLGRLASHLKAEVAKPCRAKCDICGGISDTRFARCPFCGDTEADADVAGKQAEAEALAELKFQAAPKAKVPPAPSNPLPPPVVASPPVIDVPGHIVTGATPVEEDAPGSGPSEAALATLAEGVVLGAPLTVAELDASVARCRDLYRGAVTNLYDLGVELRRLFAGKAFLQRRDPSGAPVYDSWTVFVQTELAGVCTVQYSYTLMAVARQFTREKVLEHGPKKLNLLLRVTDPDLRAELEEELPGLSAKQLAAKVTAAAGAGATRALPGGQTSAATAARHLPKPPPAEEVPLRASVDEEDPLDPGIEEDGPLAHDEDRAQPPSKKKEVAPPAPPAAPPAAAGPKPEAVWGPAAPPAHPGVATTFLVGRTKVPLFARPKKKGMAEKPAKRLADDPHGELVLPNGVRLTFKVLPKRNGELEIILDVEKGS